MSEEQSPTKLKAEKDEDQKGMKPGLLKIRLAMEASQWDIMVERLAEYLKAEKDSKVQKKTKQKEVNDEKIKQLQKEENERQKDKKDGQIDQEIEKKKKQEEKNFWNKELEKLQENDNRPDFNKLPRLKSYDPHKEKHDEEDLKELKNYFQDLGANEVSVFDKQEIELISCGFKSQIKMVRDALQSIKIIESKPKFDSRREILTKYKNGLIKDLQDKCLRVNTILMEYCINVTGKPTRLIHFKKLQADIFRYLAEFSQETIIWSYTNKDGVDIKFTETPKTFARKYYTQATELLKMLNDHRLKSKNDKVEVVQLSVWLNYAKFLYELEGKQKEALRILKKEIQTALDDFDKWKPDEIEQIKHQVELIQENINLWKEKVNADSEEEN